MNPIDQLKQTYEQNALKASEDAKHFELVDSNAQTQEVILRSFSSLVDFLDNKVTKTEVINQLQQIGTPDAYVVADAVNKLHESFVAKPDLDLSEITAVLTEIRDQAAQIPKELPEIPVPEKQIDYSERFTALESAVNAITEAVKEQETTFEAPVVNVPETKVNVDAPDLAPLTKEMKAVEKAVKSLVFPEYKTDNKEVEKLLKKTNKTLEEILDKPVGGGGGGGGRATPYETADGIPAFVTLVDGKVPVDAVFSGTFEGASAYSDSLGVDKQGLVDADRHVQTDVLSSALPTGAATAANQLPDNHQVTVSNLPATQPISHAALTELAAAINTDKVDVNIASGNITGFATSAKQDTIIGHVDGVETLLGTTNTTLGTIDADTGNISTKIDTLAGAVSGSEMQVDVVAPLPAGTNNIGDVDVASLPVAFNTGTRSATTQRVTIATDDVVPVTGTFWQATQPVSIAATIATKETQPSNETLTNVSNSVSNQTALASNANRRMATFFNDDTAGTGASVYLKCGATASATSFKVKIAPQGYYELPHPVYTGIIDVIATAATGTLRVTETT